MDRRKALTAFAGGAAGVLSLGESREAWAQAARTAPNPAADLRNLPTGGVPALTITDIKVIRTKIEGGNLINAKVYTSEPGLYGVGCGTHSERPTAVETIIRDYLKPFLTGRNCNEIDRIWQECWVAPYWRADADESAAISAVDGALWDIMGKRLGVPVYQLLGGKVRTGTRMMGDPRPKRDKDGTVTMAAWEDEIRRMMADGYDHFRVGAEGGGGITTDAHYVNGVVEVMEMCRNKIGWDIEIGTDIHERPTPRGALMVCKAVEHLRPFFMEDPFSPEDVMWFKVLREQSAVGIAMGEIFVNQNEWLPLVTNRWIDFMRMHISQGGGLNLARKIGHCCEFFDVQTAWHGPPNVSPVGHAVNLALEISELNFGICEGHDFSQALQDVFPGCPQIIKGIRYSNDKPGLGIDIDEAAAAKFPPDTNGIGSERGAHDREGQPRNP